MEPELFNTNDILVPSETPPGAEAIVEEFILGDKWIKNSPIEEVFGIRFAEGIDTWTLIIVAIAVLIGYGIKRSIDFFFDYRLEKSKKSD